MRATFHRKLFTIVAATVLACVGTALTATESSAAVNDCDSGDACIWRDHDVQTAGYGRGWIAFEYSVANYAGWFYNGFPHTSVYSADNSATSLRNNGNELRACFYKYKNYDGASTCYPVKSGRNNLATSLSPIGFNDTISSGRFMQP